MISEQDFKTILSRGRADPVWWVREVLGDEPWAVQQDILKSIHDNKRTAVRSCHSAGKSWLAARAALCADLAPGSENPVARNSAGPQLQQVPTRRPNAPDRAAF